MCWFSKTSHPDARSKGLDPLQPTASFQSAMGQTVQILSFGKRTSEAGFMSGSTVREQLACSLLFLSVLPVVTEGKDELEKMSSREVPIFLLLPKLLYYYPNSAH